MSHWRPFTPLARLVLVLGLSGFARGVQAASHYVLDAAFPGVGLTTPVNQPMGLLPLQDGGALVSSAAGFSFGDGQTPAPLLRLDSTGAVVNRQFAGSAASAIAAASRPAWTQLISGNVLAAVGTSALNSTTSLIQIALDGTVDPTLTLTVTGPPGPSPTVSGVWRLADGSVIVAGQFTAVGGHATLNLAHLTAAGAVDPAYTCQLPLSGQIGVGSDGAVVGVNPAPSNSSTGLPTLTRLDAAAAVTDTWTLPNWIGSPLLAIESSGNVLMGINLTGTVVAASSTTPTEAVNLPPPTTSPVVYRFTRGAVDPTAIFTSPSAGYNAAELHALPDGSILLVGGPTGLYPTQTSGLIHLSSSGAVDTSFSVSGLGGDVAERASRGSDGWFIESESESDGASTLQQRWREFSSDFTTQLPFAPDLRMGANIQGAYALPDNSILWQGTFETPSGAVQPFVRSGADGTLDYTHVPLTPEAAASRVIAIGPDGSIYLAAAEVATAIAVTDAGQTETSAAASSTLGPAELERYLSDGSWDSAFGRPALAGTDASLSSVAVDAQGRLLLCGAAVLDSGTFGSPIAQRLLPSGAPDSSFTAVEPGTTTGGFVSGVPLPDQSGYLLMDPQGNLSRVDLNGIAFGANYQVPGASVVDVTGGTLFLVGSFSTVLGSASPGVQRLLPNGLPDPTWHSGMGSLFVEQAQALPDGRVLVAGASNAVLTAQGAVDLNDPIVSGLVPVATGDGALTTLAAGGVIHRYILQALPAVTVQANAAGYVSGSTLTLTVSSSAQISGAVVWLHNGVAVAGVTGDQLTVGNLTAGDAGWYAVGVPTAAGIVYTAVWVQVTPYFARIANASARAHFADSQQLLVTGSVLQGTSAEPALLRILGPSLAPFGIADPAEGFSTDYYANGKQLAIFPLPGFTFPLYSGSEPLVDTLLLAGAFPSLGLSDEVQIRLTLNSAVAYTTSTFVNQPGTALFELYLPEPAASTGGRNLINFSCRSTVGTGEAVLVLGFTIEGTQPLSVLVRGLGPALLGFGLAQTLAAPLLQLYSGQDVLIGSNDHWQNQTNAAQIVAAAAAAGAFPLAPGSADAALLVTLPPGTYTAVLSPEGLPGQGMIELYEVPQ